MNFRRRSPAERAERAAAELARREDPYNVTQASRIYFLPNLMTAGNLFCGFLAIVNLATYRHYLWFIWPALGWGIALLFYGLRVFDKVPFLNGEWERRQVEKHLGRKL